MSILNIAKSYLSMYESKRASWVPEAIADEDTADFMGAAADAANKGDKFFTFGGKKYKVSMKKDVAKDITDEEINICEKCGKIHESSCNTKEEVKEVTKDTDVAEPRAKGEKDFKDMHDQNTMEVDGQEIANDTLDRIKNSGPVKRV